VSFPNGIAGDVVFERLTVLTQLESLVLAETHVTDERLRHLKGLAGLKILLLQDTHVTQESIKELQVALANCRIHWTPPPPTPKTNRSN